MIRPIWPVFRPAGWPADRAEAGLRICRAPGASADALAGSWPAAPGCRSQPPAGPAGPGRSIEPGSMPGRTGCSETGCCWCCSDDSCRCGAQGRNCGALWWLWERGAGFLGHKRWWAAVAAVAGGCAAGGCGLCVCGCGSGRVPAGAGKWVWSADMIFSMLMAPEPRVQHTVS